MRKKILVLNLIYVLLLINNISISAQECQTDQHQNYLNSTPPSNTKIHKISLLDKIDLISEILNGFDIDFPKIVFAGGESSGKSSLIESLTGIEVPHGLGTVTRCPLIIQCRSLDRNNNLYSKNDIKSGEYAEIHIEGRSNEIQVITLDRINEVVTALQFSILEPNEIISTIPIYSISKFINSELQI